MKYFYKSVKKRVPTYATIAVIVTNTIILFIVINIVASFISLPTKSNKPEELYYAATQLVKDKPELMQQIHEGKSSNDIKALYLEAPNVKSHPVLEFMTTPCSSRFYNVGFENCRYNSFINQSNIKQLMNNSTWVFGGSTAFGVGVADNETITYFLNKIDTPNSYVNFGVPAYCQTNEIEKLILLLQKGYRPKRVLFLDGLNDLYAITKSNFETFESPARVFNAYAHNFNLGMTGFNTNLIYTLPIVKLYYEYLAYIGLKNKTVTSEMLGKIYENDALYNTETYLHFKLTEVQVNQTKNVIISERKLYNHYRANLLLLDALSSAYQFDYNIFLQPIGLFLSNNPFIKDSIAIKNNNQLYKNVRPVFEGLKLSIQNKELPHFYDISDTHLLCSYPYVDLTHYSKSMNKKIAEIIIKKTNLSSQGN